MFRVNEREAALRSRVRSLHRLLLCQNETVKPELNGDQNFIILRLASAPKLVCLRTFSAIPYNKKIVSQESGTILTTV
jgi:hypothetical protein